MGLSGKSKRQKEKYTSYIIENKSLFIERLTKNLQSVIFENRFTMHPRQVRKLGAEEVESVIRYFQSGDDRAVEKRGKLKARNGFGEQSVMTLGKTLTELFLEATDEFEIELIKGAIELVDEYMTSYVSGYITGREEHVLEEQERLRDAYTTVKDQLRNEG